ncbi:MAG: mismatch repair protein MutS2 [Fimbriimonadaceae bacterium]|jgi:DNA mismatch repair protein MutS2|nr:mismatch repair protein MutS2 [Fimbriimonadaceae bacterium]
MHALRVLEFDSVLARLREHCETMLGAESCAALQPSFEENEVWASLELTKEAHELLATQSPPSLGPIRDVRDGFRRAGKGGTLGGQELFVAADALRGMRELRSFLQAQKEDAPRLNQDAVLLPDAKRLEEAIFDALEPNGDVKDSASTHLASLRQRKANTTVRLQEKVQSYTTGKSRDLLSDPIVTVRDGRYVIPLKAEYRGRIRGIVHDTSASGQTIYVEPEDVLQLGNLLREIEAAEREEISRVLLALSGKIGTVAKEAVVGIEAASRIDVVLAKARLGFAMRGAVPDRLNMPRIEIEGGRHPLLKAATAIPLDLKLGQGESVLITGPNTGGKTVAIKTVGLFVLMAQSGLLPPARAMKLGPFSQVWADIGDEQSLQQSLSTFSAHVKNIAEALQSLKPGALVLLDEIGAGTDPAEGAALAKAILVGIVEKGATVLASTHYGELKAFAFETEGFRNAAMEFDSKSLRPTYRLIIGAAGASHALKIAERYGLPKTVIEQAREGLSTQHIEMSRMMEGLDQAQKLARQAQGEADRRLAELRRKEEAAEEKLREAEEVRRTAHAKASATVDEALRQMRDESARIFEELKRAGVDGRAQEQARADLRALQDAGSEFAKGLKPKEKKPAPGVQFVKGMSVRIEGYTQTGVLLDDPKGKTVQVQMGSLKMNVPVNSLTSVAPAREPQRPRDNIGFQKAQTATTEIHLRAMRAEDAIRDLEKFIDDATLAGVPSVRIVHGKGEGILRKVTQDYLRKNPNVASFRDGEPGEGGHGVTVAVLK